MVLIVLTLALVPAGAAEAHPPAGGPVAGDPTVIADWNALAMKTEIGDPGKLAPEVVIYTGFVQAAVYDAVVGIAGRYKPYVYHRRGPHNASVQAAAAAAAHQILVTYSPYAKATLDAALTDFSGCDPRRQGQDGRCAIRH